MPTGAKERIQAQFGAAAPAYAASEVHAAGESLGVLIDAVRPQPAWTMLDVATGAGHTALTFAPYVRQVVATDLTEPMLATTARLAAERGAGNVVTRAADAEALPFADGGFDLVTCRLASHHFSDVTTALGEIARVLRPGGIFGYTDNVCVADPVAARHYNAFEALRDPSHHQVVSLGRLVAMVEETGLIVDTMRRLEKEMEFHEWADRMRVSEADKERLLAMARATPPALTPQLAPRWDGGTLHFTLWEAVLVAHKPGGPPPPPAAGDS